MHSHERLLVHIMRLTCSGVVVGGRGQGASCLFFIFSFVGKSFFGRKFGSQMQILGLKPPNLQTFKGNIEITRVDH